MDKAGNINAIEPIAALRGRLAAHLGMSGTEPDEDLFERTVRTIEPALLVSIVRECVAPDAKRIDVLGCGSLHELSRLGERAAASRQAPRDQAGDATHDDVLLPAPGATRDPVRDAARACAAAMPGDAPASASERDMWLAEQVQDGAAYHLSFALRFDAARDGRLDPDRMRRVIASIAARHPMLRASFHGEGAALRRRVRETIELDWSEAEVAPADEATLRAALGAFARPRFALDAGPLFRVRLHRFGEAGDVLQFVAHHIVFDAPSRVIVTREIVDAYRARDGIGVSAAADAGHVDAPPPSAPAVEALRDYWRTRLADVPHLLELPTDFPRPAVRDGVGAVAARRLPAALAERLAAVGAAHGASLFMVLLAGWQILLHRYSRQPAFVLGTPMSLRETGRDDAKVGYFANPVVLRAAIDDEAPFSALLARVVSDTLDAYERRALPIGEVIELAGAARGTAHTPLFQVMFEFHNERRDDGQGELPPAVPHDAGAAKYDLSLEIAHHADGLACMAEYATALFAPASIAGMLEQYEVLLGEIAAAPQASVATLACTPPADLGSIERWNATACESRGSALIHERFEARRRAMPDAPALRLGEAMLTHAELGERVDALAARLLAVTGGVPRHVALCFERSFEMLVAMLATLKAGCAYLPIDPRLPDERIDFMLRDSDAALLLTVEPIRRARFAAHAIEVLCLDAAQPPAKPGAARAMPAVAPEATAYLLYTSGSTGQPKGVAVTHANVTNLLDAVQARYPLGQGDCYLLKTNYAFDVSVPELFGWFVGDASLAILPPGDEGSPDLIMAAMCRFGVTHVNFTPSMLRLFVREAAADPVFQARHRLRHVLAAGEELPVALANSALAVLRPAAIENVYGPTEATVFTTAYSHAAPLASARVPIGRPLGNYRVHVLDRLLRPVPVGMPGDFHIAGAGVARGYLNRDALNAERFLPDPFTPGGKLYLTGDLARWTHDGQIEFLGRVDQQVKIRGYRIELDEIETALNAHPLVAEAAVAVRRDDDGRAQLVAHVALAQGEGAADPAAAREALAAALRASLPDYMVPGAFGFVAALPKGIAGKLDRRALAELALPDPVGDAGGALAPRNATERVLWEIWRAVLRAPALGVTDNFFELGGDSILSIQVAARARQQGIAFSARDLFRFPSIELLAANARHEPVHPSGHGASQGAAQASANEMPLLPIHHGFFAIDEQHVDHYQQSRLLDVPAELTPAFLEAWLDTLVADHDALRLRFVRDASGWRASFAASASREDSARLMCQDDVGQAPDGTDEPALFAAARRAVRLAGGPLFVAALARAGARRGRLLLAAHHAVIDGVSWRVLLDDLRAGFTQWRARGGIERRARGNGFQAWARALLAARHSAALLAEREHWLRTLREPVSPLLPDRGGPARESRQGTRIVEVALDAQATRELLTGTHHAYRTQTVELLLAALLIAAWRWRGLDALRIALEGHGRETEALAHYLPEHEPPALGETLGWFTSYFPQRLALPASQGEPELAATIAAVKTQYRATPRHGIGYGVLRHLAADAELAELAMRNAPEIVFNYLGQFDVSADEAADIRVLSTVSRDDITPDRPREHRLGINGGVEDGSLRFEIDYACECFDAADVEALGACFEVALRELAAHCAAQAGWCPMPADFPLAGASRDELARWHASQPALDALYPATAIQWGMVFHSLMPNHASAYVNQVHMTLGEHVELDVLRRAWEGVVARHAALRTAFVGFEREQPLQLVAASVPLPWRETDHRGLAAEPREAAFRALLLADRATPFDFGQPPLMRFQVIRHDAGRRFVWTYHHAILDGWSLQLIWADLALAYAALAAGREPVLPAAVQFGEYVAWRAARPLDEDRRYWREQLGARTERTVLAIEQAGLEARAADAAVVTRELDEVGTRRLVEAARRSRVTLAAVLQAAWALVIGRHGGQSSPLFGVTTSGRDVELPGIDTMVGPLIATLPARVDIDPRATLGDWLRTVHARHVERESHGLLDLVEIQRESGVRAGQPLFDTLLVVENYPAAEHDARAALGMRDYDFIDDTHYGLTVTVIPGARLHFDIAFDRTRYHIKDIEIMTDHLNAALNRLPDQLEQPVEALLAGGSPAPAPASGEGLSRTCRQGELRLGRNLVPHLIEDHAADTPTRCALVCNGKRYTYDELNRAANRLANRLMQACPELGTDSLVGLRITRSDRLAVAVLAIWKIGAAYIPIDPVLPPQRMQEMLESAAATVVIADAAVAAVEPATAGVSRFVFEELAAPDATLEHNPDVHVSGHDLAYVLFTSGSTGKPKGAMIEHIGMLNNIVNKAHDMRIDAQCRVAQNASMSFDVSVWQMFIALAQGGTTFVYDDRTVHDIDGLLRRLHDDRITILEVVPTYLLALVEHLEAHPGLPRPEAMTYLMVNGETIDAALLQRWFALMPNTHVFNAYGPTEASDDITHHLMSPGDVIENPVPIGRALANFDIYIVDEQLNPVPIGTRGEIVVTGVGVGRGYVGMAGATAKAFVESPFPDRYKGRLYRTGDLGVMREDGVLMFHGRKDRQVKVRGMRIELEEVEASLRAIEVVRQAAVLLIQPERGEAFLCAYVVPHQADQREAIVEALKAKLPPYMVPSVFRFETALPQLPSGKIDRNRLREEFRHEPSRVARVAPHTPVQCRLTEVFAEVLGHDGFGIHDDFFELGGDSFKAIRIAAKYGAPLEVTDIYDHPSIEALAEYLERAPTESGSVVLMAGDTARAKAVLVCVANAAGGPVSFVDTSRAVGQHESDLALFAVKLPRTPVGDDAALLAEIRRLAGQVCDDVLAATTLPVIVFAQCNGSALAIAIARELSRRKADLRALCIGGALMRMRHGKPDTRSDAQIFAFLGGMGATLPAQADEQAFFLHDFRYDSWLADVYYDHLNDEMQAGTLEALDVPVWCMVGTEDPLVEGYAQRHEDWLNLGRQVRLVEYAGIGHYLLRDCPDALARALGDVWRDAAQATNREAVA
ncbi:non-ribosomal peptide synthetase [Burkholderia gladioli]|uniref:non-ribosomal peptide synthetase n=1 Tax=Burkholderia gladioli TaxID=28095 RepID=UPI00164098A1|nr:non-ribosomal peptide synthetase [Burkholderia gladioli]